MRLLKVGAQSAALRPTRGRRIRIGVISAITRQIDACGRRIAADYEQHNSFLVFITNAAYARPTHYMPFIRSVHSRPHCGRLWTEIYSRRNSIYSRTISPAPWREFRDIEYLVRGYWDEHWAVRENTRTQVHCV